jgi:hypothetical protein
MTYTYPGPDTALTQAGTAQEIHQFMKSPTLLARRIRDLSLNRYIADYLLVGRFTAQGGAILYPTGEPLFANDNPEIVAPLGEYPLTSTGEGAMALTKTAKWGQDAEISDEAISRFTINPVERILSRLVNQSVKFTDATALGVIASKITATKAASAAWTTGSAIITDVFLTKAVNDELNEGYSLDTVILKPTQMAKVMATLMKDSFLPRETTTGPLYNGVFPDILGLNWVTSTNVPFTDPLLVDRSELGGMADEPLVSPGYTSGGVAGIQVKTMRRDEVDGYRVRCRRLTVPIVLEPNAGVRITGTGL